MNGLLIDCFAGGGGASKGIELALNRPIDIEKWQEEVLRDDP
jgi:hypothetical protein